jgi:hypothetical protein
MGLAIATGIDRGLALAGPAPQAGAPSRWSVDVTEAQATAILGRELPVLRLPRALVRTALTADPEASEPTTRPVPRMVRQSFATQGRNVALLTIFRGSSLTSLDGAGTVITMADGISRNIRTKQLGDGTTNVGYYWSSNGLLFAFDVNLVLGIDRTAADALASSIR